MFFRTLNFFILLGLSLPASLEARRDQSDLIIAHHISRHKSQELFQKVVKNNIPGKRKPDDYQITLGHIKNVKRADAGLLRNYLESTARIYLKNARFTPVAAKKYLVNRAPNKSDIILVPKAQEAVKFKILNAALHQALRTYNTQWNKRYVFHTDTTLRNYQPHITLATSPYIQGKNLNRDRIIRRINAHLKRNPMELLQRSAPQLRARFIPFYQPRFIPHCPPRFVPHYQPRFVHHVQPRFVPHFQPRFAPLFRGQAPGHWHAPHRHGHFRHHAPQHSHVHNHRWHR